MVAASGTERTAFLSANEVQPSAVYAAGYLVERVRTEGSLEIGA